MRLNIQYNYHKNTHYSVLKIPNKMNIHKCTANKKLLNLNRYKCVSQIYPASLYLSQLKLIATSSTSILNDTLTPFTQGLSVSLICMKASSTEVENQKYFFHFFMLLFVSHLFVNVLPCCKTNLYGY